jgi:hypothetical protein
VTFLLFLASVVVLEYLVRDVRPRAGKVPNQDKVDTSIESEATTADLIALGRALGEAKTAQGMKPEVEFEEKQIH